MAQQCQGGRALGGSLANAQGPSPCSQGRESLRLWPCSRAGKAPVPRWGHCWGQELTEGARAGRGTAPGTAPLQLSPAAARPRCRDHAGTATLPGTATRAAFRSCSQPALGLSGEAGAPPALLLTPVLLQQGSAPAWQHQAPGDGGTSSGMLPPYMAAWSPGAVEGHQG